MRERLLRKDRPRASTWAASNIAVFPAPLGPQKKLIPGESSTDSWVRFRKKEISRRSMYTDATYTLRTRLNRAVRYKRMGMTT